MKCQRLLALRIIALTGTAFLTGCIHTPLASNLPPAPISPISKFSSNSHLAPYRLQIGDVLDVKLMLNPELSDQVTVLPDGTISTILADDVEAYGNTLKDVRHELEKQYRSQLNNPHISLMVRSFAPNRVYVTGEVNQPGEFISVGPNLTLLQSIARAGGVKNSADTDHIVILRRGVGDDPEAYAASYTDAAGGISPRADVRLASYDIVYVPRTGTANTFLYFQQYLQQYIPDSFNASYLVNGGVVSH